MAVEDIGELIPTKIPGYADPADIQAALRAYHYGSYDFDFNETDPNNLISPSMAKTIYDIQDDITNIFPSQTSNSGKYLTTNGTVVSWASVDAFPSQTGNSGKYLTTNGTSVSWATVDALPSQTGNSGKYLTTNGVTASWTTISADIESVTAGTGLTGGGTSGGVTLSLDTTSVYVVPSQTGNNGKFLTTNGSTASWASVTTDANPSLFMIMGA